MYLYDTNFGTKSKIPNLNLEIIKEIENALKYRKNESFASYVKANEKKKKEAMDLYNKLKRYNKETKDEEARKLFINECFQKILGINVSDITNISYMEKDKTLVGYMMKKLIDKINKEREKEYAVLNNIYNIMLSKY